MLKGAIVGFGKIAQTGHMLAYNNPKLTDKIKITSVVEPYEQSRLNGKKYFPELNFYQSINELFANEQIDFVDITCPPVNHYDVLKECIKKKVHIICEKPFTLSVEQAKEIQKLLTKTDKIFIPCHQYKYSPVWKNFKKFIDDNYGKSKPLMQFTVFRTEADPGFEKKNTPWRTNARNSGGGILADTGVHYIYLASWMLGNIERVCAQLPVLHHKYNSEDSALITFESPRGIIQITLTWAADRRFNDARAVCAKSSIFYENGNTIIKHNNGIIEEISVPDASEKTHYISLYVDMFLAFISAIENGVPKKEWIDEAFNSIYLMNCCYQSSEEGKTIRLKNEK